MRAMKPLFSPTYLPQQRKIRGRRSSVSLKLLSEPRSEQPVLDPHSNLRSCEKHRRRYRKQQRRCRQEPKPPKHAKHRRIDRMPHQPVRSAPHQLMFRAYRRIEPKMLPPQCSRRCPRQCNRKRKARQRSQHSPKLRRHRPESALQHQRITQQLQQQTPARPPVHTLYRVRAPSCPNKRSQPKDDSANREDVAMQRHRTIRPSRPLSLAAYFETRFSLTAATYGREEAAPIHSRCLSVKSPRQIASSGALMIRYSASP